jgi:hypothetical protein
VPALVAALEEHYGPARFTVRMVLEAVGEDEHGALANAVAAVVNMNAMPEALPRHSARCCRGPRDRDRGRAAARRELLPAADLYRVGLQGPHVTA